MLLIHCPWCGPREEVEFHYGGQADLPSPTAPLDTDDVTWSEYLFVRANPKGPFTEGWSHGAGCRRWFAVLRDIVSNEITDANRLDARCAGERAARPAAGWIATDRCTPRWTALRSPASPATRWPRRCSPTGCWRWRRRSTGAGPRGIFTAGPEERPVAAGRSVRGADAAGDHRRAEGGRDRIGETVLARWATGSSRPP